MMKQAASNVVSGHGYADPYVMSSSRLCIHIFLCSTRKYRTFFEPCTNVSTVLKLKRATETANVVDTFI